MTSSQGTVCRDSSLDLRKQNTETPMVKQVSLLTQRSRCHSLRNEDKRETKEAAAIQRRYSQDECTVQASQDISQDLAKLTAGRRNRMDFKSKAATPSKADKTTAESSKPVALYTENTKKAKKQQSILHKVRHLLP